MAFAIVCRVLQMSLCFIFYVMLGTLELDTPAAINERNYVQRVLFCYGTLISIAVFMTMVRRTRLLRVLAAHPERGVIIFLAIGFMNVGLSHTGSWLNADLPSEQQI